jgi:RimJ/RimL family protein N-acetyltransferase
MPARISFPPNQSYFPPNQSISEFHTFFRQANDDDVLEAPALNQMFRFHFRLVEPADAAFICTLRSDPELNRHLSPSSPDVEAQRRWIESYKAREAEGCEFYFVIVADDADQGVVRMYDFREIDGRKSFCWGSWIIKPPRPPSLVTFSAICIYELGFNTLGFEQSHFDVRRENTAVTGFHHRAGAKKTGEDELNLYFEFPSNHFSGLLAASTEQIKAGRSLGSSH